MLFCFGDGWLLCRVVVEGQSLLGMTSRSTWSLMFTHYFKGIKEIKQYFNYNASGFLCRVSVLVYIFHALSSGW